MEIKDKHGVEQAIDRLPLETRSSIKDDGVALNGLVTDGYNTMDGEDGSKGALRTIYLTMLLTMSSIAIGITSAWPYLQRIDPQVSPNFLGWANFGFNLAAIIGDLTYGRWMLYRPMREPLLGSLLIMILAGLCSAFAQGMGRYHGLVTIFVSRVLLGMARGNMTITRAFVAESSTHETRSNKMANLVIAMAAGFTVGSAIQSAMVQIGEKGAYIEELNMHLNLYTIPAWIIVLSGIVNGIFVLRYIKPVAKSQTHLATANNSTKEKGSKICALACLVFMFCAVNFSLSAMETLMAPFIQHQFALTRPKAVFFAGLVFTIQGLLSMFQQFAVKLLTKRFQDRLLVAFAFGLVVLAFFMYVPLGGGQLTVTESVNSSQSTITNSSNLQFSLGCPKKYDWCYSSPRIWLPKFIFGAVLFAIGYSSCLGLVISLFSKMIPAHQQSTGVSIISAFANSGRLTAPIAGAASYVNIGPTYTFAWLSLLCLCGLIWYLAFYKDLNTVNRQYRLEIAPDKERVFKESPLESYSLLYITAV